MQKTHGYRKLAVLMAFVFVMGLILSACSSSSQSSTDDALSHPGPNYLGSLKMVMNPSEESITITPMTNALTDSDISVMEGFEVSMGPPSWDGSDTLSAEMEFKWVGPERVEDISIRVVGGDEFGLNAIIDTNDNVACASGAIGNPACLGNVTTAPGVTYVAEEYADGPESQKDCLFADGCATSGYRSLRLLPPGCGPGVGSSVKALWSITETTGGNPTYTFYARAFGTKHPANVYDDGRYSADTATFNIKTYRPDPVFSAKNNRLAMSDLPVTTVATGEWFYAVVWADSPGDQSRVSPPAQCADGDGDTLCAITQGTDMKAYDYYFVEDQVNFDEMNTNAWWETFAASNTGFLITNGSAFVLQWDPAVLESNSIDEWPLNFTTAKGTLMSSAYVTAADDHFSNGLITTSNSWNRALIVAEMDFDLGGALPPPIPDGLDGNDYGAGYQQGDFEAGAVALHAVGASGSGSSLRLSPGGNTSFFVTVGGAVGTPTGFGVEAQTHDSWPMWASSTGLNEDGAGNGHYNVQIGWVCVQ